MSKVDKIQFWNYCSVAKILDVQCEQGAISSTFSATTVKSQRTTDRKTSRSGLQKAGRWRPQRPRSPSKLESRQRLEKRLQENLLLIRLLIFSGVVSLSALGISFVIGARLKLMTHHVKELHPIFTQPVVNVFRLPLMEVFWWSPSDLHQRAGYLFETPNSVGTIALGAAEGTRTHQGNRTPLWKRHIDPGNGAVNKGTFSWQLGAATPEEADRKGLQRIQREAIPHIIDAAVREQVGLDLETLIQGADLWNQSPDAGKDFVKNLRDCLNQHSFQEEDVIFCARVASFYNPETGELEASGFDWDPEWLEEDQRRRMAAIKKVLEGNQDKLIAKR